MSADLYCQNCRRVAMTLDPSMLGVHGVGVALAEGWAAHRADCNRTCDHCGHVKDGRDQSCGSLPCRDAARDRRTADRMDDIETLLLRTTDPDVIARAVGLQSGASLRAWLRANGRADLVTGEGPLAPGVGVAA